MSILLLFAFISGLVTILAPCIWPLLPIVLSASSATGKLKPLGITLGITSSFAIFTLTISYIVKIIPFDPNILRLFAVLVIGFLGLTLLVPKFNGLFESWISAITGKFGGRIKSNDNGFKGGFITGLALGLVWAPCSGPILATIATLAATQAVNLGVILVTLAYVSGVGIPLFIFSYFGQNFFRKSKFVNRYTGRIQQAFGIIMILTALAIYTNYDKVLQVKLLDSVPSYTNFLTKFENNETVQKQLNLLKRKKSEMEEDMSKSFLSKSGSLPNLGPAPEFIGISKWLNTDKPLALADLRGKVVLIDFWTYTCINCIRTLPHVTSWYEKYKDQGFVIIGVHTPEFEFEKKTENVFSAMKQYKINYPVAQDNDYKTWTAYDNHYWPAEYLVDAQGNIRRTHFGEGEYEETEKAIQSLLKETGQKLAEEIEEMPDEAPKMRVSPETYLGSSRMQYYYPEGNLASSTRNFTQNSTIPINSFSLGGAWTILDDHAEPKQGSTLQYNFYSQKVFLVIKPPENNNTAKIKVYLDNKIITGQSQGVDVKDGVVVVDTDRLYNLVDLKTKPEEHLLRLEFLDNGISIFAFTFG